MSDESSDSQNAFLGRALHDLRAPARHVRLFSEMLRKSLQDVQLSDTSEEYLDVIERAGRQMQTILESLGNFLKLSTTADDWKMVDVAELLAYCWDELPSELENDSMQMKVEGAATIWTDAKLLSRVFTEAFENARRFRKPQQSLQVICEVRQEADQCQIRITDNGIGIKPKFLARVVQPFERLPAAGNPASVGLGLALCQNACDLLKGSMTLTSDGSSGTTFALSLPLER